MGQDVKSKNRYIVGPVERFDQKNNMVQRVRWDPDVKYLYDQFYGEASPREKVGHTHRDRALQNAAWYLARGFGDESQTNGLGLYARESRPAAITPLPAGLKLEVSDPAKMSRQVKRVARFLGASQAGICELDRRWLYSYSFDRSTLKHEPLELPPEYRYAIALAIEMDYELTQTSPTCLAGSAIGLGYSMMAFVAGLLASFIRELGYQAISCGNDTALSVPIALDAGLGELGRNGILITEEFGPRVRLCKVLTDMPLQPDPPHEFGVARFCEKCTKCARYCPSQAIHRGERTDKPLGLSNNGGVLKWPIDAERCFKFWAANGANCNNCIRVCPFNKPKGWFHDLVRWGVKHAPWSDGLLIRGDDLFGYGRQTRADRFWEG